MLKKRKPNYNGDLGLIVVVFSICIFGIVMIYSASSYSAQKDYGDAFFFVKKQIIGLLFGIVAFVIASNFDYRKYAKIGLPAVCITTVLLGLVFIPGLGVESYGAKRWINLGVTTLQPSDLAKFGYIIFVAGYFAKKPERMKTLLGLLPVLFFGALNCVLIMLEPNMSITVCFALLMLGMIFLSGAKWQHIALLLLPLIILAPVLIIIEPYRLNRLSAFINPWASPKGEGYQLLQSLYALGSGGWFGVGLFNSRQKFEFLPFSESDFILSVIGEEIGIIGLFILFFACFYVTHKGLKTAINAKNLFGFMLSGGITLIYAIQLLINVAVVSGSIPPTGLSFPLISSGNTSVIVFLFGFGIINNVAKHNKRQIKFNN